MGDGYVAGVLGTSGRGTDRGSATGHGGLGRPPPTRARQACKRDPIFLSPDYRVDPLLGLYVQCAAFRKYTAETKRNYATDIGLLLTFLWGRDNAWIDAVERDLGDYEHWRRLAPGNPDRISGTKWDRELAAFASLYGWAAKNRDTGCTHNGTATGDSAMTPGALAPAAVPWPSRRRTAPMETRS